MNLISLSPFLGGIFKAGLAFLPLLFLLLLNLVPFRPGAGFDEMFLFFFWNLLGLKELLEGLLCFTSMFWDCTNEFTMFFNSLVAGGKVYPSVTLVHGR